MSRILKDFKLEIETLCYCSKVEVVAEVPQGCAILSINAQCEIHLMLKGIIEVEKEVGKLEKKSEQLQTLIGNLKKKMSNEDYAIKVPAKVQTENAETLKESEIEIERIQSAIEALKLM
jgi:valyl-tRNA synthetase